MKFLSISKAKDSASMLPPTVARQLLEMSAAGINQQKKLGKVLEFYYSPAGYAIVILEYKSAEEWVKDQNMIPILSYYDSVVYPLAEGEEALKSFVEGLKAAEKMMAGAPR
jgi:hypothetical protein